MTSPTNAAHTKEWWKEAVVYQIYPASFLSTGAGTHPGWGDIRGITAKVDYLKDLGVDVVWSSPFFPSPQVDLGYDISDYTNVDPRYGTLADIDALIAALRARHMHLLIDLVVNHTSDQHAWFLSSRSSRTSPKRNWYHWQPPRYDSEGVRHPPNNWAMQLGEAHSAWTWDEATQEYYLALFTPEQPDLNWENPEVREAVKDVLRFWLDRGASGFRMDVINHISKVEGYPDADIGDPAMRYQPGHAHYANGPRMHEYLQELHRDVLSHYPHCLTVGEMPFAKDNAEILRAIAADRKEINQIFIFDIVNIDDAKGGARFSLGEWKTKDLADIVSKWQTVLPAGGGWNALFLENHDQPRSVSRYTNDSTPLSRALGAKLLALMQTTLSGTLYIYQGEELGMVNFPGDWPIAEYKDIETVNYWNKMLSMYPNDTAKLNEGKEVLSRKVRDHARTPVQWNAEGKNAGFCEEGVQPWMRVVGERTGEINAQSQGSGHDHGHYAGGGKWSDFSKGEEHGKHHQHQPHGAKEVLKTIGASMVKGFAEASGGFAPVRPAVNDNPDAVGAVADDGKDLSVWQFWQRGLANRKKHRDVFIYGSFTRLDVGNEDVFAYRRASHKKHDEHKEKEAFVVLLNFTGKEAVVRLNGPEQEVSRWVTSNYATVEGWKRSTAGEVVLRPWEGVLGLA